MTFRPSPKKNLPESLPEWFEILLEEKLPGIIGEYFSETTQVKQNVLV
jgi:hypothetical protein